MPPYALTSSLNLQVFKSQCITHTHTHTHTLSLSLSLSAVGLKKSLEKRTVFKQDLKKNSQRQNDGQKQGTSSLPVGSR